MNFTFYSTFNEAGTILGEEKLATYNITKEHKNLLPKHSSIQMNFRCTILKLNTLYQLSNAIGVTSCKVYTLWRKGNYSWVSHTERRTAAPAKILIPTWSLKVQDSSLLLQLDTLDAMRMQSCTNRAIHAIFCYVSLKGNPFFVPQYSTHVKWVVNEKCFQFYRWATPWRETLCRIVNHKEHYLAGQEFRENALLRNLTNIKWPQFSVKSCSLWLSAGILEASDKHWFKECYSQLAGWRFSSLLEVNICPVK